MEVADRGTKGKIGNFIFSRHHHYSKLSMAVDPQRQPPVCLPPNESACMSDLLGAEGGAPPKAHTARPGRHPDGANAFYDHGPLEVGYAGEHG
jgi:hypothetical protein